MNINNAITGVTAHPAQYVESSAAEPMIRPLFTQLMSIARRRKWVLLSIVAAALVIGVIVTLLMTPMYHAESTLEIQRENGGLVNVREDARSAAIDQEFYETQYGLLKAKSLAERVATNLRLQDDAAFFAAFGAGKDWFDNGRVQPGAPSRADRVRIAGQILLNRFTVDHERQSRLVKIGFTSPSAVLSKRVIDSWGASFIQMTLERRFGTTAYARQFLETRLNELRRRIDASERRLVGYAAREGIINLPSAPADATTGSIPERSLASDDLATLNQELARARADRIQAESRLGVAAGQTPEALQNSALGALRQQRADLAGNYAKMMAQFSPDYPPAKALHNQISQLDQAIRREEGRVGGSLREAYNASVEREKALTDRVGQMKSNVLDLRRRSIQYNIYQRDADTNRQLYDALLQRYKEIGIAGGVGTNNISVVDAPEVPGAPSSPKLFLNLLIALVAGLAIGAGAAWILEQIDQGIADPDEVPGELQLPLLGTIPKILSGDPLSLLEDRKSMISEAYVSIQTNLSFTTEHGLPKTLAITSSRPAEGKSTTAFALALSMARLSRRVLLIDGDMRSPSVHHLLDIQNREGLSNFLAGGGDWRSLVHETPFTDLSVMTSGPIPPSAPDLLTGRRLEELLGGLLDHYDNIVIDAPPVMGLADAPLIGTKVEGMIYVVESHSTQKGMVRVALSRLRATKTALVGVVLTKFDAKRAHYGYDYNYAYGYGYGDKAGESPR